MLLEYIAHKADDGREQSVKIILKMLRSWPKNMPQDFSVQPLIQEGLRTTSENIRWLSRSG